MDDLLFDWDNAEVENTQDVYWNIPAGPSAIRIVSNYHKFKVHWYDRPDGTTVKLVPPKSGDPLQARGETPSTRYAFQVLVCPNKDGSSALKDRELKVLEVGPLIYNEVVKFAKDEDYGNPTQYDFKINKSGSGKNGTNYEVKPRPVSKCEPLTDEIKARVKNSAIDLAACFPEDTVERILEVINGKTSSKTEANDDDLDIDFDN